jgi:hypothetical protein
MARAEINEVVWKVVDGRLAPGVSLSVQVDERDSGDPATVYLEETGGTTRSNPLTTDSSGRIEGWLDAGSYDLTVSGTGITTYTQPFEATSGAATAGAFSDGSVGTPGLRFIDDPDTGAYRLGTNRFGFATGGVLAAYFQTDGTFIVPDAAAGDPTNLTSGTSAGSIVSGHNRFFRSINNAKTSTVRVVGVNNNDEVVMGGETGTNPSFVLRNAASTTPRGELDKSLWLTATNGEGYVAFTEQSPVPNNPAANGAHLYVDDNGSGKTRLMVIFNSGASQQIAIQP